jgi:hypothetical protein
LLKGTSLISYSRPVDSNNSPPNARKAANNSLVRLLKNTVLYLGGLALLACQSESPNTTALRQADVQQESPVITDSQVADLIKDSLLPPAEATLAITSEPGFLQLTWDSVPDQRIASIYKFDRVEGFEVLVAQNTDSTKQTIKLPSRTHQRAWHSEQFRIELCDPDDCVSSARVPIAGLVEGSLQRVYPSVFVQGEKFADSVAFNSTASLMAVSLPIQGAIDLYSRSENFWRPIHRISLEPTTLLPPRIISLGLSPSGDTVGALVTDGQSASYLKIWERFGEAWFETTSLEIGSPSTLVASHSEAIISDTISISEDSNLILISLGEKLFTTVWARSGWTTPSLLQQDQYQPLRTAFTERFSTEGILKAASANLAHTRIFTIHSLDQSLWLSVWEQTPINFATPSWNKISAYAINNINSGKDVSIHSDSSGDRVVIAGWELNNDVEHTPVLWRYEIPSVSGVDTKNSAELSVIDSIRFPFTAQDSAVLRFSADGTLNQLVLGWQSEGTATSTPYAALIAYRYSTTAMRWLPKLELPEAIPTFAKQSFVRSALLSADGEVMIISIEAGHSLAGENRVGELVTLQ